MPDSAHNSIDTVMHEERLFPPSQEFSSRARIGSVAEYEQLYAEAAKDPVAFWSHLARQELHWFQDFQQGMEWNPPHAKWFVGGQTNACYNCLDVHLTKETRDRTAIIWEGEPGDQRSFTYAELHTEVCKFANVLKQLDIKAGDVVSIYMPMVPEMIIAVLACARIGAIHSVIFAGFSAEAIADRNQDANAKLQITADGGWRRGKILPLKSTVDEALKKSPSVEKCIVLRRTEQTISMIEGRDLWWHDLVETASADCPAEALDSDSPLFILYTSGSTGKPKGIKHATAGYQLFTKMTFQWVFDWRPDDVYWCTADCGWITGHSYIIYGPLSNGATTVIYEGAPDSPTQDRFWDIVERHKVSILYTAPTAIRTFIKWGDELVAKHNLDSLRLLGTVGEGINPEAWIWYHEKIGQRRCPIVDTWWQTETGGIMMSPLPGAIPTKPGSCTKPLPGILPKIVDESGCEVPEGSGGWLVFTHPWPGMLRGIWGDDQRYEEVYWSKVPGNYLAGDNARMDKDGYYWIMGRIDDVINVSGHRLSTIEVESALVSHPDVTEAAVVARPDELTGQAIAAFVTVKQDTPHESMQEELKRHVRNEIGALAVPHDIRFTASLPKTRSGKIMRRLLRDIAEGKEQVGDTTTLEDYSILAKLREDNS